MTSRSCVSLLATAAALLWALLGIDPVLDTAVAKDKKTKRPPKSLADELPRIPPVQPARATSTFTVQHGFQLELVASEPLVADPVDACFDAEGRLYVAQMHGYPFSQESTRLNPKGGGKPDAGVVSLLVDSDGDGRFDRSTKFADKLRWPTSVCCFDGGVFVLAPPSLHYFKDTDGDGVADIRKVIYTGFRRDNVQSVANNMKWGLDNRITLAAGRNGGTLRHGDSAVLDLSAKDFSFDPHTFEVRPLTGGIQFGNSFDAWGNRFVCSNSNHIQHITIPRRYLSRHPGLTPPAAIRTIAAGGAAAPVFRKSRAEPWRLVRTRRRVSDPRIKARLPKTEQFATGFFTSATGVTIFTGDAYPAPFAGNAFIGDVGGNLVHRKTMSPSGPTFVARRADKGVEFIASTDNWFRPVNFVNGPDGALYVIDMYRETIEHPYSIPDDIKRFLRLESGDDRGRIYRLVPPGWKRLQPPRLKQASIQTLIASLESRNGWTRWTAHRLLFERNSAESVPALAETATHSELDLARVHSLWILHGLGALDDAVLLAALADKSPRVREHAVRLSESRVSGRAFQQALGGLTSDSDPRVRYQLAFSLGSLAPDSRTEPLLALAHKAPADKHLQFAVFSSSLNLEPVLLRRLAGDRAFVQLSSAIDWLAGLSQLAGANPGQGIAAAALAAVLQGDFEAQVRAQMFEGLGRGLARRGQSVTALIAAPSTSAALKHSAVLLFGQASSRVSDSKASLTERITAAKLLGFAPSGMAVRALSDQLDAATPPALQSAAVSALGRHPGQASDDALVTGWKGHSPRLRADIVDVLVQRTSSTKRLLDEVEAGRILATDLTLEKRQLLANSRNAALRSRAARLLKGVAAPDRAQVIARYKSAVENKGDAVAGAAVFKKICSACHRVGEIGHKLGPDLASVSNKSPADLLVNILDPNREAQPNFMTYTLVTLKGRILTGMVSAESATSVTLRRAEGKQDIVARPQIDTLSSNGKSLMPEGLEKELSPKAARDIIAFIKSLKPAAASK